MLDRRLRSAIAVPLQTLICRLSKAEMPLGLSTFAKVRPGSTVTLPAPALRKVFQCGGAFGLDQGQLLAGR